MWSKIGIQVLVLALACLVLSCGRRVAGVESGTDAGADGGVDGGQDGGAVAPAYVLDLGAFSEPPVSARPWVRWWWPGGDVEDGELARELHVLAEAYFGGAEVQAIDYGLDPDAPPDEVERRLSVDTPAFFGHVAAAMRAARELGLQMDLTLGSGWPTGGTHIPAEESLETLVWGEQQVKGPGTATLKFTGPDKPHFYTLISLYDTSARPMMRYMPEYARLVAVVAARLTGGKRTAGELDFTDHVDLDRSTVQVLYPDLATEQSRSESLRGRRSRPWQSQGRLLRYARNDNSHPQGIDTDGEISWEVPEGTWQVVAFYSMPSGDCPIGNAQAECGFVADHFDTDRVINHIEHLLGERTGFAQFFGSPMRGFFVDSFEFKVERFYADDFLAEFQKRRGYDITPLLPAVVPPGADNNLLDGLGVPFSSPFSLDEDDARFRHDYQRTASELFIERFAETARQWAESRGLAARMQGYGLNVDVIRAAGSVSIPEAEQLYAGGPDIFLKMVSSGAHLYGRNVAGAESFVWNLRDYWVTPSLVRAAANKLFAAGINHVIYHGSPYQKMDGYGETGWQPFSSNHGGGGTYSDNHSGTSPFWAFYPEMNRYLARCQVALREGGPESDLLVYYPWFGFPASFFRLANYWEPLYNGRLTKDEVIPGLKEQIDLMTTVFGKPDTTGRLGWVLDAGEVLYDLHAAGYSWDWANEHSLLVAEARDGRILVRGRPYKALIIMDTEEMVPELAAHLADLAAAGARIILAGAAPSRQPGYFDHESGDAKVASEVGRMLSGDRVRQVGSLKAELTGILEDAGAAPGVSYAQTGLQIRHIRRRLSDAAQLIFFSNPGGDTLSATLTVDGGCAGAQWLDPWTGSAAMARTDTGEKIPLTLDTFSAKILACGVRAEPGTATEAPPFYAASTVPVAGWTLHVEADDVPGGAVDLNLTALVDWREVEGLRHSAGPGVYRAEVDLPAGVEGKRVVLDLGRVEGAVESITWDDNSIGPILVPPFTADVTGLAHAGQNTVEVRIKVLLRNRLVGKCLAGEPGYDQFKSKENALAPAGLLGPVEVRVGP